MRMGLVVVVLSLFTSSAAAQALEVDLEALALRSEAREVTGLYAASGCLLGTALVMGVAGGLTSTSGDSIGPGVIPLFALPGVAAIGFVLLTIAIGYDAGLARWSRARHGAEYIASQRRGLGENIAWTYGIGLGVLGLAGLGFIPVAAIDGFRSAAYLIPTIGGGVGLFILLAAAGMDVAAGAWSGFSVSASPTTDGAMASASGTF